MLLLGLLNGCWAGTLVFGLAPPLAPPPKANLEVGMLEEGFFIDAEADLDLTPDWLVTI